MKRRFENNLLRGVALRFVKTGRSLRLAKDICYSVIADVVACAEVRVRVVIESAPANTASVLRIRSELIVDACVTQRVLTLTLIVVDRLARIRVAYKLRVEIARMIRRLQRKDEVVHGEDIFEKL